MGISEKGVPFCALSLWLADYLTTVCLYSSIVSGIVNHCHPICNKDVIEKNPNVISRCSVSCKTWVFKRPNT